jgi:hypothetical protein
LNKMKEPCQSQSLILWWMQIVKSTESLWAFLNALSAV